MSERSKLAELFKQDFSNWEIELTTEATESDEVGMIVARGWTIWLLFGNEDGREHLDYYAMHRMTNDRHVRRFADGTSEQLDAIQDMYSVSRDASVEEQARGREEFRERNREIQRMLEEKGFRMTSSAHLSAQINRYLLTKSEESGG